MKRSVILTDRLGPDILSAFWTKGQVLHRERAHLEVSGFSTVLNVLLTRKLSTFLSRLNEISGGCEKIAPVSGSFCSILKLLRMIAFYDQHSYERNLSNCLKKPKKVRTLTGFETVTSRYWRDALTN